jgi:hypothetical protein
MHRRSTGGGRHRAGRGHGGGGDRERRVTVPALSTVERPASALRGQNHHCAITARGVCCGDQLDSALMVRPEGLLDGPQRTVGLDQRLGTDGHCSPRHRMPFNSYK